jgi:NitT/TauT family transport system permease protein
MALILCWGVTAWFIDMPILVPTPFQVAEGFATLAANGDLFHHLWASLSRLCVGLLVGAPLGAFIGCAMGRSEVIDAIFNPFVRMFNSIPALALVPFSLMWFGATELSRYTILIYTISLTVLLSARAGAANVRRIREQTGWTLGLSPVAILFRIILPSCFPAILAGVRTAIGLGVMVIVAAEMIGAESGFGYLIMQARSHFNMVNMLVGVIGLGLLSLTLDRLFVWFVETLLPRWSVRRRV